MNKFSISIASLLFLLFLGCIDFTEDIDEINAKINSLIEENSLLRQTFSENTANISGVTASISGVTASIETIKNNLTQSIEDLKTLQQSLTESQTTLLGELELISLDIESIV